MRFFYLFVINMEACDNIPINEVQIFIKLRNLFKNNIFEPNRAFSAPRDMHKTSQTLFNFCSNAPCLSALLTGLLLRELIISISNIYSQPIVAQSLIGEAARREYAVMAFNLRDPLVSGHSPAGAFW